MDPREVEQFTVSPDDQQVIQPAPTPVSGLVQVARFPDPIKGTSVHLVCLDAFHQLGLQRAFMEPGAAKALAAQIEAAADLAANRGIEVMQGAGAHQFNRQARRAAEREARPNGR